MILLNTHTMYLTDDTYSVVTLVYNIRNYVHSSETSDVSNIL